MSTYTPIASITLSAATSSVSFVNIPQTYTDLVVVVNATNSSGGDNAVALLFNGDTGSNYSMTRISGDGTSASSERSSNITMMYLGLSNSTVYNSEIYHIMNYANTTTNKTAIGRGNVANSRVRASVGLWRNTAAITSVTVINDASVNFASGSTFNLYGISANDAVTPKATGGNQVYSDGTNWIHVFTSSGTFTPSSNISNVDFLVIAGGGGGGDGHGSGGGAGGYRTSAGTSGRNSAAESKINVSANTSYTVTVGAGGAANAQGGSSTFSTITSTGGGFGGQGTSAGGSGGSGGGGNGPGGGTANQGFGGGSESGSGTTRIGGGGGGASAAGNAAGAKIGGDGLSSTITGSSVTRAGGGGGGMWTPGTRANGGSGGGGLGATGNETTGGGPQLPSTSGQTNTGSGGGGGAGGAVGSGASGGSGIVIVRYAV